MAGMILLKGFPLDAFALKRGVGADHLIPVDFAFKIAKNESKREVFALSCHSKGHPSSTSCQGILFWQAQTMQMMYEVKAREMKNSNLENLHPQDYLNFYCLGNCEQCEYQSSVSSSSQRSSNGGSIYLKMDQMLVIHLKVNGID